LGKCKSQRNSEIGSATKKNSSFTAWFQRIPSATNPIFREQQILKLEDIYKLNIGIVMYKIIQGLAPSFITHQINKNQVSHHHHTRQVQDYLNRPQYTMEVSRKALSYKGPNIFNSLTPFVKNSNTLHTFKYRLKNELLSNY
jgi:hypothetical protein